MTTSSRFMQQRTRIKMCGLTREADVQAAVNAGADAIGFVFYEPSPRHVTLARAVELAALLPPFVMPVGLFVNAASGFIEAAVSAIVPLMLQFHGDETPAQCRAVGRPYIRAARMGNGFDLLDFATRFADAKALLLDAQADVYGGSGEVFDWSAVPAAGVGVPLILSGGLKPTNVLKGIVQVRPWAVDVSSGIEAGCKGVKDAQAMKQFCAAVRQADDFLASTVG